jgi:AraC-like DNA-binding protein
MYRKSFFIAILISTVPTALVGLFIYVFGTQQIEKEVNRSHQISISNAIERIDGQFDNLERLATLWAFNPTFSSTLQQIDLYRDADYVQNIYSTLATVKSSDPLIEEVYIYMEKDEAIISGTNGIGILSELELEPYNALLSISSNIFWTDLIPPGERSEEHPYSLIVRLSEGTLKANSFMIFRIKAEQLDRMIADAVSDPDGSTLLLDHGNELISSGRRPPNALSAVDNVVLQGVSAETGESGSFLYKSKNSTYSVSFNRMKRMGETWALAAATPTEKLTAPVVSLSRFIVAISIVMLTVGLWLSWLASRRLYKPIERLIHVFSPSNSNGEKPADEIDWILNQWTNVSRESKVLQERLQDQLPALRGGFLLQLIQGHLYSFSEQELHARMRTLGWNVENRKWMMIVIQLNGLFHKGGKFTPGDEQLVTFAASNIAAEWVHSLKEDVEIVNFQNLSVGLLLSFPVEDPLADHRLSWFRHSEKLAATLHQMLRMNITIGISKILDSVSEIPAVLDDAAHIFKRRLAQERTQIIDLEEIVPQGENDMLYPFEEEKEFLQAMRLGLHTDEVEQQLDRFYMRLREQSTSELQVRQGLFQIYNSIQHIIIQLGVNPLQLYDGIIMNERIAELHESGSMIDWLKGEIIRPLITLLQQTQNLQIKELVEGVLETIHREYMKDISLDSCAELHNTYSRKLSVSFKQVTGWNFIDYLTNYRLEKARQLLLKTEVKINDVAESVGYQPAYFHRLFKKHTGVTPGQYREQQGANGKP